ncbi:MAG TPA: YbhB/YbcL family Raf kinase inhibitor-like protein [Micromonosporaceae bacterium]
MLDRPSPYDSLKSVPALTVTSDDLDNGGVMPMAQVFNGAGGGNVSPHLQWSGEPEGTKGYAVTLYDPDAPTVSGFWHWQMTGIPASVTALPSGAGAAGVMEGVRNNRTDFGTEEYGGAAPPAGDGAHRYIFAVSALDTDDLGLDSSAGTAVTSFAIEAHTIARGLLTVTYEQN